MSKFSNEKRKYQRIYRHYILSYGPVGDPAQQKDVSQINNISQGGLNFSVSQPLQENTVLAIELRTPFLSDTLHLQGQVLECKEKIADLIYEVRVQFKELPLHAKEVLAKIEQYALANQSGEIQKEI